MGSVFSKNKGESSTAKKDLIESIAESDEVAQTDTLSAIDTTGVPSKLEQDIIQQVEHYFGDFNLNRDKFLLSQMEKNDGWVPLSLIMTFKRLAALTKNAEIIVNALMKSDNGLIEISGDKIHIRRHPARPVPEDNEEHRKELISRTAYAKGFPADVQMSTLLNYFSSFENVVHIIMRKYLDPATKTYKFKGSVFVIFETKEQAKNFIEMKSVLYEGYPLLRFWEENYLEHKNHVKLIKEKKEAGQVPFQTRRGTVVHFQNATDYVSRDVLLETIKDLSYDQLEVILVRFLRGNSQGYIHFREENTGWNFVNMLEDDKFKLNNGVEMEVRLLCDEEEEEYIRCCDNDMYIRRKIQKNIRMQKRRFESFQ